jgi:hypothetical protein
MDKRLTDILARVLARRDAGVLGDDEYRYLEGLMAPPAAAAASEARPLWAWVHERLTRWAWAGFELDLEVDLGSEVNMILADAGAHGAYETSAARWAAPVTRKGLQRALAKHLTSPTEGDDTVRGTAALLAGLAGFDDFAPHLVTGLAGTRDGRWTWYDDAVLAALQSLAMLDAPAMRELAPLYARHDDSSKRAPARAWALRNAESLGAKRLAELLSPLDGDGASYVELLMAFPDAARLAVKGGLALEGKIVALLEGACLSWPTARALGALTIELDWKEPFAQWLSHGDAQVRAGAALAAAWGGAKWALKPLRARIKAAEETDDDVRAHLALADLSASPEPGALAAALEDESPARRLGAAWACLGVEGMADKLVARFGDDAASVRLAATCAWAIAQEGASDEFVGATLSDYFLHVEAGAQKLALRALEHAGVALPPLAEDLRLDLMGPALDRYDDAKRFYAQQRRLLMRWAGEDWYGSLQAELFPDDARASLEASLAVSETFSETRALWRSLSLVGGPATPMGRLRGALVAMETPRAIPLDDDAVVCAVLVALSGDDDLRARVLPALAASGPVGEAVLSHVLTAAGPDDEALKSAVQAASRSLEQPADALLVALRDLFDAPDQPLTPGGALDWIDYKLDAAGRRRLAERAALPGTPRAFAVETAVLLLGDSDTEVGLAALRCLAKHAGGEPWVGELLVARTHSSDWNARRLAAQLLAPSGHPAVLARLLALTVDSDTDVQNAAAEGLLALAAERAELGLAVLDIRDPERVRTRYKLTEEVDYANDARAEGLRLLLLGLDARKDAKMARARKGQKLVVTRLAADAEASHAASARPLSSEEFEALALYLRVDFADDETGSIVAVVDKDPTGEVLNALLQTESLVVATGAWS